jgi:hypothetical protein
VRVSDGPRSGELVCTCLMIAVLERSSLCDRERPKGLGNATGDEASVYPGTRHDFSGDLSVAPERNIRQDFPVVRTDGLTDGGIGREVALLLRRNAGRLPGDELDPGGTLRPDRSEAQGQCANRAS